MYIAPEIHRDEWSKLRLDDEKSSDWDRAIYIFNKRILSRYLEPVDLLIKEDNSRIPLKRQYGFAILAIDCLLIETLQSFREGVTDTQGRAREMFVEFLTGREGFREHFNMEQATRFYYDFRCGILHQAEVMGSSLLWSVGPLIEEKADGILYLNRTKVHELIKNEVERYADELRDPINSELRKRFRFKMNFIARMEVIA